MKRTLLTLSATTLLFISMHAMAQEPGQMADPALTDPDLMVTATPFTDPNLKVTKTVEKTTTKTYTVTKRRVGMIGSRPYPIITQTEDGGTTVEKFVNDVKTDTHVVTPDPMLDKPDEAYANKKPYEYPFREYYTDDNGMKVLGQKPSDVEVRHVGNFND